MRRSFPTRPDARPTLARRLGATLLAAALVGPAAAAEPFDASKHAMELDAKIDWSRARLIAVQDRGRYKTLESFARESIHELYGREHFPGLSPLASLFDWLFNREAYLDTPVVRIKDKGLRVHFSAHMPEAVRRRIVNTGFMTPRELADPVVKRRMAELETRTIMARAMNRARSAEAVAEYLDRMIRIVPHPAGDATTAWHTPDELRANLPDDLLKEAGQTRQAVVQQFGPPIPEISTEQTLRVLGPWATLKMSWQRGDAEAVQDALDRLADALPTLAPPGVYPSEP